jgi:hypothetical protein
LQDPPKFTQILIFGLKTNHLATLIQWMKKFETEATMKRMSQSRCRSLLVWYLKL